MDKKLELEVDVDVEGSADMMDDGKELVMDGSINRRLMFTAIVQPTSRRREAPTHFSL